MSMSIGTTYKRDDGATFECSAYVDGNYFGDITDDRGPRRHAVPGNDHAEWKVEPQVQQMHSAQHDAGMRIDSARSDVNVVRINEERKAPKKR